MRIKQENWLEAAKDASNFSELQLTLGEVTAAVASGERSVAHADLSGDIFERLSDRTTHADALHQYGDQDAALALFQEAEALQKQDQPEYPCLYSLGGFLYCDLLLALGESSQVLSRAKYALAISVRNKQLLSIALDHLSIGRGPSPTAATRASAKAPRPSRRWPTRSRNTT